MKKILCSFLIISAYCGVAAAYKICGPDPVGGDFAYAAVIAIAAQNNRQLGAWAVGENCGGGEITENMDVATMCDNVIVGGQAYCASGVWSGSDLNEATADYGSYCWCRRTKMQSGGALVDSEGQWVLLGSVSGCKNVCAKYCAQHVNGDITMVNQRNAIMMLPAF